LWLLGLLVISGYDAKVSAHIASAGQDANAATMRKARALVEYLEKTKDKRVEKVVVNKFGFSGAPKEEYVNYTVKIGDIKYQVGRPGKDQKGANYVAFDVWAGKTTQLTVTDEGIDGSVDAGMDVKAATKEEKKVYGTKAYVLSDRDRWQAEYEKFLDAVIGHLGIVVP
jgi:hypothetical protein